MAGAKNQGGAAYELDRDHHMGPCGSFIPPLHHPMVGQYPSALGLGSKISAEIAPPGIRKAKFYPENPFLLLIRQGVGGILSLKL
jgi:hypothetical protein